MKISIRKVAVLLLTACVLYSCKKDKSGVVSPVTDSKEINDPLYPEVENGRMVFASHDAFYKYVDAIDNNEPGSIEKLHISGFTSSILTSRNLSSHSRTGRSTG